LSKKSKKNCSKNIKYFALNKKVFVKKKKTFTLKKEHLQEINKYKFARKKTFTL